MHQMGDYDFQVPQTIMSPYTPQYAHLLLQHQVYQANSLQQHTTPTQSASETPKKIQVYVSNLSPAIKDGELTQLFQAYHGFSKARVTSAGCGLVEFTDQATAQFAISQVSQRAAYLGSNQGLMMQPVSAEFCP